MFTKNDALVESRNTCESRKLLQFLLRVKTPLFLGIRFLGFIPYTRVTEHTELKILLLVSFATNG